MNIISEETLLAYADGELDAATRAEVEAAIAADPALAQKVEQHRALRSLVSRAYEPVLDEPMPARLLAAAQAAPARSKVVDLAAARAERQPKPAAQRWSGNWAQWGGMAACLLIGIYTGRSIWLPGDELATRGGELVARGELARSLSTQLASTQAADAPVRIGLSFVSRDDSYCRSFTSDGGSTAGLACRKGDDWQLRVLSRSHAPAVDPTNLRMAASPIPPAVLQAAEAQMRGGPLDAQAERAAAERGWRKP
jgi:hypothetical protein